MFCSSQQPMNYALSVPIITDPQWVTRPRSHSRKWQSWDLNPVMWMQDLILRLSLICTLYSRKIKQPIFFRTTVQHLLGGSHDKESTYNVGDLGSIPGSERSPEGGHDNLLQYSCLENPLGQRSLAGYSPRGRMESDMTE